MIKKLIKIFVKEYDNPSNPIVRVRYGNFASVVGILCNVFLCIIKGVIGLLFNSVSILADAFNNLSDAGNSIISLIGFLIAEKPADKDHPYGHERIEYISCLIVSFFIVTVGFSLLKSSVLKIITPVRTEINYIAVTVLVISVMIKLWMGFFYKKIGKIINSDVLYANSTDSYNDVISTSAVLMCALLNIFANINLDAFAGLLVSVFIVISGFKVLRDTVNKLLGTMPEKELVDKIIEKLNSYDGVMGIHDLVVHSYGPSRCFATVHVEVPVDEDILVSHDMIDNIERDFSNDLNINLVIHLDPVITNDEETLRLKDDVCEIVKNISKDISFHDFRIVRGETHSNILFDIVIPPSFDIPEKELVHKISGEIKKIDSNFYPVITVDKNYISRNY